MNYDNLCTDEDLDFWIKTKSFMAYAMRCFPLINKQFYWYVAVPLFISLK